MLHVRLHAHALGARGQLSIEGVAKERAGWAPRRKRRGVTFGGLSGEEKERTERGISFNQTRRICGSYRGSERRFRKRYQGR